MSEVLRKDDLVRVIKEKLKGISNLNSPVENIEKQYFEQDFSQTLPTETMRERWRDCIQRAQLARDAKLELAATECLRALDRALQPLVDVVESATKLRTRVDGRAHDVRERMMAYLKNDGEEFGVLQVALDNTLASIAVVDGEAVFVRERIKLLDNAIESASALDQSLSTQFQEWEENVQGKFSVFATEANAKLQTEITKFAQGTGKELEQRRKGYDELKDSAEVLVQKLTRLETLQGVAKFSDSFAERGNRLSALSKWWFIAGCASLAAAIFVPIFCFRDPSPDIATYTPAVIEHIAKRVVFVLGLLGFSAYCLRSFRVQRDLREDYKHRQLALETFNTFKVSAHDQATKDRVLLWACRTIFSTPTSASSAKAADGMQPDPELVAKILAQLKG